MKAAPVVHLRANSHGQPRRDFVAQHHGSEKLLAAQYVDGSFGTKTVAAYKAWQKKCGYSGSAADGIPGRTSLTKLGAKHGFGVTA